MDLDPGLKGDPKDDGRDDGEPEVAAHYASEETGAQANSHIVPPFDRLYPQITHYTHI